jgi:hypothetical protein
VRGASRLPTFVGRVLIALGFVMILVAWDGASKLDYIQGQFPFLLSGAIPGLGVIIIGAGLEYVQTMRQLTAQRARQMAEVNVGVAKLIGFVKENGGLIAGDELTETVAAKTAAERLAVLDAAGHAFDTAHAAATAVVATAAAAPAAAPTATAAAAPARTSSSPVAAPAPAKSDPADEVVIAGRSSFHDPQCHLVTGRDDMAALTRLEAEGQGLTPCRVCKP